MRFVQDVTVVIPLHDREALIGETLEAILAQTLPPAAVIVVDDGSTDGSAAAAERFGPRVTVIRNPKLGVQAARNTGLARAETAWVALCDSDDLWRPTWLESVAALRAAAPDVDLVFGNFQVLRDGAVAPATKFDAAPAGYWERIGRGVITSGWVFDRCIAGETFLWHPIFPSAMAFSKDLLARAGAFDVALAGSRNEDGEFTLRLLYRARAAAIPDPLVLIRKHGGNVSGDQLLLLLDEIRMLGFVKQTHPDARPYHATIDREVARRTIAAADLAFAARRHDLVRELAAGLAPSDMPAKLRLKRLVAALPERLALPANGLLQRMAAAR